IFLGDGTTGVAEQLAEVRRRSHWLSIQLDEEHLPGLDAPALPQPSLEKDLSVLVTPHKSLLQASSLQIFYEKEEISDREKDKGECSWIRDLTSTGPVLARVSKEELQDIRRQAGAGETNDDRKKKKKVFILITCEVPCAPHITVTWQVPTQASDVALKCDRSEGNGTGGEGDEDDVLCPVVSGETLPGVPVHYTFQCTGACRKALEGVDRPNLQVVVSPALHQPSPSSPSATASSSSSSAVSSSSSSSRYKRLEVLAAWNCMPETLDVSETTRNSHDDWGDGDEDEDDEVEEDSSVSSVSSSGINDSLPSSSSVSLRGNASPSSA
ncbi:transmembrane protein, partial [Cystoisospora suis]